MLVDAAGWGEVSAGWFAAGASLTVGVILSASGLGSRREKDWRK